MRRFGNSWIFTTRRIPTHEGSQVIEKRQQQQIFPGIALNLSPKWKVNFGVGVGVTRSTDHLIGKMILGYQFDF
jgi:hypothetical protein